jgi:hypothetical protein
MFKNFGFPRSVAFMGYCEKVWYSTARGYRQQCNKANERCLLNN